MITTEITKQEYTQLKEAMRNELIQVATLDGKQVAEGVASCAYDLIDNSGYSVHYQI